MKYVVPLSILGSLMLFHCAFAAHPGEPRADQDPGGSPVEDGGSFLPPDQGTGADLPAPPPDLDPAVKTPDLAAPKPDSKAAVKPDSQPAPKQDSGPPPTKDSGPQPTKDSGALKPGVIFTDGFETKNSKWKAWGDWQRGKLAFKAGPNCDSPATMSPPPKPFAGQNVYGTNLNDCYSPANNASTGCTNTNPKDDSILRLELKIPPGYKKATLTYMEWADFFKNFDWSEVRVNDKVVLQNCTGGHKKPTTWVQQTVDLTPHIGKNVGIEFHFLASGVINLSGWYIDSVTVRVQ